MRIGIEAERANNPIKTGVEHYAKELILQFAQIDTENEFILYLRSAPEEWITKLPPNFSYKVMPFPIFWTQLRLSWEMWRRPPDVLFIPASSMPLVHPRRTVVTVHDLAFMYYPETYTAFMRYFHMFEDVLVSVMAKSIIAVSNATKQDFVKFWKVDQNKISVVYHGYTPLEDREQKVGTGELHNTLPEKYVLFLSTLQPRKNLIGLTKAFRLLKEKNQGLPHKLVVVGRPGWKSEPIMEEIQKNKDIVVYLNYVSNGERAEIYKRASAFCLPSFYEGFGMWILESWDAGVPVITSSVSSMPEVGGEACAYGDPSDIESIAQALEHVLLDEAYAKKLVQRGGERLVQFSWRKCAQETLAVLLR